VYYSNRSIFAILESEQIFFSLSLEYMMYYTKLLASLVGSALAVSVSATDLVIATVNNGHMIEMQKLTPFFEKANPDIKVKWVTLEEGTLR